MIYQRIGKALALLRVRRNILPKSPLGRKRSTQHLFPRRRER